MPVFMFISVTVARIITVSQTQSEFDSRYVR